MVIFLPFALLTSMYRLFIIDDKNDKNVFVFFNVTKTFQAKGGGGAASLSPSFY